MSLTNTITSTISQLDSDKNTLFRRTIITSDEIATAGDGLSGLLIDTSQHTITLPIAQVRQLWFNNTHATAQITVVWTRNGGAEATVNILGPNDQIMFWSENTGSNYGISSLKLQSDTANATYTLFLGG